ncbi:hypothetical protein AGMMS49944_21360 [Spirochaetia bacterium]|nr:hypothetical protein AGMMS49944_21360 [Spirochaetia bacterium]
MPELMGLVFYFGKEEVVITYKDIPANRGVTVCVPNLEDKKWNFIKLSAIYSDDKPEEYFEDSKTAMEFLHDLVKNNIISLGNDEFVLPSYHYTDITDTEILGKDPITEHALQDDGIWANNGLRIINVKIENIPSAIEPPQNKYFLQLDTCNGKPVEGKLIFFGNKTNSPYQDRELNISQNTPTTISGDIYLDTNELGKYIVKMQSNQIQLLHSAFFLGNFHIDCDRGISYDFKIKLLVQNTYSLESCKSIRSEHPAFIDFGTSSTCVCVWDDSAKKPRLLSFDNKAGNGKNTFENPTSVIIYRWAKILKKFNLSLCENYSPILKAGGYDPKDPSQGDFENYINGDKNFEFDSGYVVKELLNAEPTNEQLKSIISRIKTIPYILNQQQNDRHFFSYDEEDKRIQIISSLKESQDADHINPLVIYGYLLGKMINDASGKRIYTDFRISRPIKFPRKVVEEIKQSLGYGLKLSVPHTLRDKVTIGMDEKNIEPVAYLGAVIGPPHFKVGKGETKRFAVFDFGGGTLDTIFGVVHNKDGGKQIIDIYSQGGEENFGGESLIEKLSFKLYSLNYKVDENLDLTGEDGKGRIPMRLPSREDNPSGIPPDLINSTSYDREGTLNLQILGEQYSRHFFEIPGYKDGESTINVKLLDKAGRTQDVKLNLHTEELGTYLYQEIEQRVDTFAQAMDIAFDAHPDNKSKYDRSSVTIFKAGNASRNKMLEASMDKIFPDNKDKKTILMPDASSPEESEKKEYSPIYGITPKSAVALGQYYIYHNTIKVNPPEYSFKWYVGYTDAGTGDFERVLDQATEANEWNKIATIPQDYTDSTYKLHYKEGLHLNSESQDIPVSKDDYGKSLFIKTVDEISIKYCFAKTKKDISEPGSDHIISLN